MFENLTVANQSNVSLSTHVRVNDTSFLNQVRARVRVRDPNPNPTPYPYPYS